MNKSYGVNMNVRILLNTIVGLSLKSVLFASFCVENTKLAMFEKSIYNSDYAAKS